MFDAVGSVLAGSFERAPWGWGVFALLVTAFVKLRPTMAKLAAERESSLLTARAADNHDLRERIEKLERVIESERTQHEAERRIDRHRLNNITQCFDALVLLLEMNPERVSEALTKVKAMRAEQMKAEALEKGAAAGAVQAKVMPA